MMHKGSATEVIYLDMSNWYIISHYLTLKFI